jgi:hypothetical protein
MKWSVRRKVTVSTVAVILVGTLVLYLNLNRLLSSALVQSFNSTILSDVYELKFGDLRVNLISGDVAMHDFVLEPRMDSLKLYPYINSTLSLKAERLTLVDAQFWTFLTSGTVSFDEISIRRPEITLIMAENRPNLFPISDSAKTDAGKSKKKAISGFALRHFRLENAHIHVANAERKSETTISNFDILLNDLLINQGPGVNAVDLSRLDLRIGDVKRTNLTGPLRHSAISNFQIGIDSFGLQSRVDTVTYKMTDFTSGFANLDLQTADSIFHVTVGSFSSSYKDRRVRLGNVSFVPNISKDALQARSSFQKAQLLSANVVSIEVKDIDFDSLIYHRSLFVDSIVIDQPSFSVFKDKTKPLDTGREPEYFGQQIAAVKIPLRIRNILVRNVQLINEERKPDGSPAKITIEHGTVRVSNVTTLSKKDPLVLIADAYLSDKLRFGLQLDFSYAKPEFRMAGNIGKFELSELNTVLKAYTPATIISGVAEQITFEGKAGWTNASGTMKFLYHDLEVDLALKDQARWASSLVSFAANSVVNTSNPGSADLPPRVVKMRAERDMNKGFVNIIIKSLLNGVKETLVASKENRERYQEAKKKTGGGE